MAHPPDTPDTPDSTSPTLGGAGRAEPTEGAPPFLNRRLSLVEWSSYVAAYDFGPLPPSRVVLHHTVIPTEAGWAGLGSMRAMQRFYAGKGWTAGPHLYAAPDGIWLATRMYDVGIHAGTGNGSVKQGWYSIGLEMVGAFDTGRPAGAVWAHALAVMAGLGRRLGIAPRQLISFHRDYTSEKSCPGWAVTKPWVWDAVEAALAAPPRPAAGHPILAGPSIPASDLVALLDRRAPHLSWQQRSSLTCAYTALGALTGIGNLFPLAQAIKEASHPSGRPWFGSDRFLGQYNPAGLGATNDGAAGAAFATIEAGVLAQYAHLINYAAARPDPPLDALALADVRRLALANAHGLGCAPTWEQLNGRWAVPGPTYGQDIATIALAILEGKA